ncbi:hypothetical protein LLG95_06455 [bacterium]|nr:hypothetical protein [bacterium]
MLIVVAAVACTPPEPSKWPRARVLLDPPARRLISDRDLTEFPRLDGSFLELNVQPADRIRALIAKGGEADVVIVTDPALWRELHPQLAGGPWRFEACRRTILIVTPADGASSGSLPLAVDAPDTETGRMAQLALKEAGIWKLDPRSSLTSPKNILLVGGEAAAIDAVRAGRSRGAVVLSDFEARMGGSWRVERRLDPYPDRPGYVAGGVPVRSAQPELARRAWSFLERAVKPRELGYAAKEAIR